MATRIYEINYSKVRERRGMGCYAVMRKETDGLWIAVSVHHTREDADAAKAGYEAADKAEG